ncbi:hypothetical protein L6452_01909 [Arctium lappa]|uniref:Uncharacterized protein n=1 Tax=Arctium lappa TaxID=4217 RepID=A0ACB9FIS2_ARCLA|nr:hypothetical protein L6452_01909 [Arctium lappa]
MTDDYNSVIVALSMSLNWNSVLVHSSDYANRLCSGHCRLKMSPGFGRICLSIQNSSKELKLGAPMSVCPWGETRRSIARGRNGPRIVMSGMAWELGPGYVVKSNNITGGPIHVFSPPKMETLI